MNMWLRVVVTLILAPLLWRLGVGYVANQQGTGWGDVARQSSPLLASVYLTFTVPALVLCAFMAISDLVLRRLGLDLLTVFVSPVLAAAIAAAVVTLVREPHVQAAEGAVALAAVYGLVWGLTIREPRRSAGAGRP